MQNGAASMKEGQICVLSLCSAEDSPRSKHWWGGDMGLLAKLRTFSSLGWTPHPSKLHHTRKNSCKHSRAIFINEIGRAILLLINIHKTWTREASPSKVLRLGCLESWVRTHSGIPEAVLHRARSWSWIILVGAFQLRIFYDSMSI